MLGDGVAQKGVALLGPIAVEGLGGGEVVYGGVHGGDDGRGERAGDVADAHLDEARVGVRFLVGGGAPGDFREQVAAGQLLVVAIDAGHGASFMVRFSDALRLGGECFQWEKTRINLINGQISAAIVDNLWASRLRRALGVFERPHDGLLCENEGSKRQGVNRLALAGRGPVRRRRSSMKLTRRGFLAGAGAVAAGSAAWGLDPNRAWADEEVAEEPAGTDEAPAEEPAAPAGPVVVCEECPGACTLVLEVEDGRVAAVRGDGANPFSEGRLCLRAQALTDLWKAPEGATEDGAGGDGGNGAGGNDAASEGAMTAGPGRLTSPRVRRAGSDAWEDISWDRALDEIANLVKDTRDATFEESIEGVEADDEAQGETGFDEWDWSDRGGYGDDGYERQRLRRPEASPRRAGHAHSGHRQLRRRAPCG